MDFIIWLVCVIGSYVLAKNKNRRGWAWALASAFFVFIPLIILFFLKAKPAPRVEHNTRMVDYETKKVTPERVNHQPQKQVAEPVKPVQQAKAPTPPPPKPVEKPVTPPPAPVAPPPLPMESASRFNLNDATEEEILTLPGVNKILAKKIMTTRDNINGFESIEHFQSLLNLSASQMERIAPMIIVEKKEMVEIRRGRTVDF